jgi:DNA-binding protein Fis
MHELFELTLEEAEKFLIEHALRATGNNVSEAARRLGITRMTMRYRMKQHGLNG